jgi:hypothetical protein
VQVCCSTFGEKGNVVSFLAMAFIDDAWKNNRSHLEENWILLQ